VTDKCICEAQLAEQFDPARTNPNLAHNVRKKVVSQNWSARFCCRLRCYSQQNVLPIDSARALESSLEVLKELIAKDLCRREFRAIESAATELFEKRGKARSIGFPPLCYSAS
jgi:hypothetical protein